MGYLFLWALFIVPFLNHIVYCFQQAEYVLLLAGALVFPVGWLHGVGLFLGFWG